MKTYPEPKMVDRVCACGKHFQAREADVKRGWGKSCSKSCAAKATNKKTGNYARYMNRKRELEEHFEEYGRSGGYCEPFDNTEHQNND